jgi:GT2 family glycosyltransferase
MDSTGKVSVIVVNYNSLAHIDTCLESVLSQTFPDFEIIFVDNNSTDGSLEHARAKFPKLTFVVNKTNLGYAGGINSGLALAAGEYIAPLNIDTEVSPDWLAIMVRFMDSNPKVGAVTPKILLFDERDRINTMGINIHVTGLSFCRRLSERDNRSRAPEKVAGVSGCSYLIRRELLVRMGGAPSDCFMAYDDVVVSWLLNLMGYEMYCLPEAVVFHKYRLKINPAKFYGLESGRQELVLSSLKPTTLVLFSPLFFIVELMTIAHSLINGKLYAKAKFDAFSGVWRERARISQKRLQYERLRRVSDLSLFRKLNWNLEWKQLLQTMK